MTGWALGLGEPGEGLGAACGLAAPCLHTTNLTLPRDWHGTTSPNCCSVCLVYLSVGALVPVMLSVTSQERWVVFVNQVELLPDTTEAGYNDEIA